MTTQQQTFTENSERLAYVINLFSPSTYKNKLTFEQRGLALWKFAYENDQCNNFCNNFTTK